MATTTLRVEHVQLGAATHGFRWMTFPIYRAYLSGREDAGAPMVVVTARDGVTPAGLLVAELDGANARVVSLFVHPRFRNRGCARRMFDVLDQLLERAGIRRVVVGYAAGSLSAPTAAFLLRRGFSGCTESGTCYELRHSDGLEALIARRDRWLPARLDTAPWISLDAVARRRIQLSQAARPWYPNSLSPFRHEARIEPETSLALLAGGEVAGWAIGHRIQEDTVHYATIFVRPDLRNLGAGAGLFFTALSRHCKSGALRNVAGRFLVRDESARMAQLIERRLSPFTCSRTRYLEASKSFN
jgi:GNAT superfamily N-acetyltransferase